jgi:RHH-type proline utilization regulon transcriptional repressor/proline dehydrogenase/delta 1-pyrroline-5-carboxylate dehydrogenase
MIDNAAFDAISRLQPEIETRGLEIFERMAGEWPGVFKNVTGRLMDWSMRNESVKVQLFRFVDVLRAK